MPKRIVFTRHSPPFMPGDDATLPDTVADGLIAQGAAVRFGATDEPEADADPGTGEETDPQGHGADDGEHTGESAYDGTDPSTDPADPSTELSGSDKLKAKFGKKAEQA